MSKEIYTIELDRPEGVSSQELVDYMREAIEDWGGQRASDDPLFYPWKIRGAEARINRKKFPSIRIRRVYP